MIRLMKQKMKIKKFILDELNEMDCLLLTHNAT